MSAPETTLQALHQQYCRLTGRNLTFSFYQREWFDWSKHFVAADLDLVMAWINRENSKRERRYQIRTDLLRLIGDLAVFDSLKAEAELEQKRVAAKARAWKATAGETALGEFRKTDPVAPAREPTMPRAAVIGALDKLKGELQ